MPSRKQRRRRAKERRHEYEVVYVDQEGHEVEVDPEELKADREQKKDREPAAKTAARNGRKPAAKGNVRVVPAPSWTRVLKRAAIIAPFMLLGLTLLARKLTWQTRILETLWLLILFVPFAYMIDRMMYRRYLRQTGQEPPPSSRPPRKPREPKGSGRSG
jgi:hypothetical protein